MSNCSKKIEIFARNMLRILSIITTIATFGFIFLYVSNIINISFIYIFIPIAFFNVAVVSLVIGIYLYLSMQVILHKRRKKKLIKSIKNIKNAIDNIQNSLNKNNINFDYAFEAVTRYNIQSIDDFYKAIDQIEKDKCAIKDNYKNWM